MTAPMTAEIAHFALILALLVSLAKVAVPFIALRRRDPAVAIFADQAAFGAFVFIVMAFACLTYAFVNSDFRFRSWLRTPTRRNRSSTRLPASGATTRARCCSGSSF